MTTAETDFPELRAFRAQTDPSDLLEMQVRWAEKGQKGILEHEDPPESLASDLTGSMVFQGQTGCQVNWVKSDLLEQEAGEVKWVLLVLLGLGDLLLCIKARTCVPTPAPPVCTDTPGSPA